MIAFCPDQLGPAVYRQIQNPSQYDMVTFPRRTGPAIVDWVDYAAAVQSAGPSAFAADVVRRAGADHNVWLVWEPMYKKYGVKCESSKRTCRTRPPRPVAGGRNVVTSRAALLLRADEPDRVPPARVLSAGRAPAAAPAAPVAGRTLPEAFWGVH